MATQQRTIDFLLEQATVAVTVTAKPMFGEYGVYVDGKMIGSVCDDQLFVKPTLGGRAYIGEPVEAPPYPGAKLSFLIEGHIDDREWLVGLIEVTTRELPAPKSKRPKPAGPKPR